MTNLMLLLLAALVLNCAPAICAEASDQDHEEGVTKRSPAKRVIRTESPAGSVSTTTTSTDSTPASTAGSTASGESGTTSSTSTETQSTPDSAVSTSKPSGSTTSTPSSSPVDSAPTPVANSAKAPILLPSEVAPGPYETDRRKVRNWLLEAKKRGVGLGAYIPVWDDMESTVKSGGSDAAVKTKLDTICRNIGDQVKNSSTIQRFRPVKAKEGPDEELEVIPVRWVGQKGSDPLFRNISDKWYQDALNLLNNDQRSDPQIQRRLHDQRDMIYKEMSQQWKTERKWAPKLYRNMNQDMGAVYNRPPTMPVTNDMDPHKWYGGTERDPVTRQQR